MKRASLQFAALVIGMCLLPSQARADMMISDHFIRMGPSETLVAPFISPSTSTVNTYGGFVEIIVSGVGNSLGPLLNDAFYGVPGGVPLDPQFYQLNIGWSNGAPLFPFVGEPRNANNIITFIENVGFVTPPATPAYNGVNNTYQFVVSVPANAGNLQFGVSDGIFADNGGQYNIQVFQLQPAPVGAVVPEPAGLAMMALGAVVLVGCGWRRMRMVRG